MLKSFHYIIQSLQFIFVHQIDQSFEFFHMTILVIKHILIQTNIHKCTKTNKYIYIYIYIHYLIIMKNDAKFLCHISTKKTVIWVRVTIKFFSPALKQI